MDEKKPFMPPPPQGLKKEELPPRPPMPQEPQLESFQIEEKPQEEPAEKKQPKIPARQKKKPKVEKPIKEEKTEITPLINWSGLVFSFLLFGVFVFLMFI